MAIGREHYDTSKQDAAWVYYKLNDPNYLSYSGHYKVHLSFDQNQLAAASEIILPILFKYRVHHFKLIHSKAPDTARNVHGKELTIYLQKGMSKATEADEDQAVFWINIFNELEAKLISEKIDPNLFKPLADKLFPGSKGYIGYRYPNNILDRYTHAVALKKCGFTINEAYNNGKDYEFEDWFKNRALHEGKHLKKIESPQTVRLTPKKNKPPLQKSPILSVLKAALKHCFMQQLSSFDAQEVFYGFIDNRANQPHHNLVRKLKAIFGTVDNKHFNLIERFSPIHAYQWQLHQEMQAEVTPETERLKDYLNKCLDAAAQCILEIYHLYDISFNITDLPGKIIPAIYWHFFIPIAEAWKKDPESSPNILQTILITEIVKGAFRDGNVDQIDYTEPQYLFSLDPYELDLYAIKFSRQFSPHFSTTARLALKGLPISQKVSKPDTTPIQNPAVKTDVKVPDNIMSEQQNIEPALSAFSLK